MFSSDWITHQHRDTLASIAGHATLNSYLAIADGEAIGRVKFEMTEVRLSSCSLHRHQDAYVSFSVCLDPVVHLHKETMTEN